MTLQEIKHQFFTYRNGAVGESLRRLGAPYKVIFGLNLPQLNSIARQIGKDKELAENLWANVSTRESLLLAPMIYPPELFSKDKAMEWIGSIPSAEVSDIMCMKLLRGLEYADSLADTLMLSDRDMDRYTALRLMFNRLPVRITETEAYARAELSRECGLTTPIAHSLLQEIAFLKETE